ncbi:hypothetical protein VTJ04DRAFT_3507 [Mycothermus thermophilus]|uniref:uncharacterized protein n=1 Tax=Humicola insolens TaxID=85995 RepID=UPI00374430AB
MDSHATGGWPSLCPRRFIYHDCDQSPVSGPNHYCRSCCREMFGLQNGDHIYFRQQAAAAFEARQRCSETNAPAEESANVHGVVNPALRGGQGGEAHAAVPQANVSAEAPEAPERSDENGHKNGHEGTAQEEACEPPTEPPRQTTERSHELPRGIALNNCHVGNFYNITATGSGSVILPHTPAPVLHFGHNHVVLGHHCSHHQPHPFSAMTESDGTSSTASSTNLSSPFSTPRSRLTPVSSSSGLSPHPRHNRFHRYQGRHAHHHHGSYSSPSRPSSDNSNPATSLRSTSTWRDSTSSSSVRGGAMMTPSSSGSSSSGVMTQAPVDSHFSNAATRNNNEDARRRRRLANATIHGNSVFWNDIGTKRCDMFPGASRGVRREVVAAAESSCPSGSWEVLSSDISGMSIAGSWDWCCNISGL